MTPVELVALIGKVKSGDEASFELLLQAYLPLVESMADKYRLKCEVGDAESLGQELKQDARFALYKAAMSYDTDNGAVSFGLYAKICIRNALVSELRRTVSAEKKSKKVRVGSHDSGDSAEAEAARRMLYRALSAADASLSDYEKTVISMLTDGKTVAYIADATGNSAKSVSNAVFRAKRKLKSVM